MPRGRTSDGSQDPRRHICAHGPVCDAGPRRSGCRRHLRRTRRRGSQPVDGRGPHPQLSGVALNLLRNKRNVSLDFKNPAGRDALLDIAATCDVFVTNLRPSTLGRARLGYTDVSSRRPDIVYCQAHGYPSDGPRADDPAYDDVLQAETGLADAMSRISGHPMLAATVLVDKVCGLVVASSVMAALFHRAITGEGQRVEVPMAEVASAFTLVEHGAAAIPAPLSARRDTSES